MAAVVTKVSGPNGIGDGLGMVLGSVAMDSNYPTGGESLTANSFGLGTLVQVYFENVASSGHILRWTPATSTTGKVKAFWVDTTVDGQPLLEVADTTDLSAITACNFIAIGRY